MNKPSTHQATATWRGVALAAAAILAMWTMPVGADELRPNFIVVLADDLGYGDLGCYGNSGVRTPNLDRFADEGLRLTACYSASPVCSPARAGLLTGRTPHRMGIYNWVPMDSPMHLRRQELTIASLLRTDGYATCLSGKWHLNGGLDRLDQPQPADHGFDHWFATQNNALPNHGNPHNFFRNGQAVGRIEGYAAEIVADEAIRWLRDGRPRGDGGDTARPFFLYVAFHEPHEPIATDHRYAGLYPSDDPSFSAHHGNITQMDAAFGRLMSAVDELGLRENTLVLFTSDNGPAITPMHPHGSAGPLRAKKSHMYEGGIRVPGLIRWPARVKSASVSDEPVSGVDLLPTLCQLAGLAPAKDRAIDGASFVPIFDGRPIERSTPLYWHYNWAQSAVKVAMRIGDWKLLATLSEPLERPTADLTPERLQGLKRAEPSDLELYDLRTDVAEAVNLVNDQPQRLASMERTLRELYGQVRAEGPEWPAWQWPRHEGFRIRWPDYWLNRGAKGTKP